jgi:hypothetical protein
MNERLFTAMSRALVLGAVLWLGGAIMWVTMPLAEGLPGEVAPEKPRLVAMEFAGPHAEPSRDAFLAELAPSVTAVPPAEGRGLAVVAGQVREAPRGLLLTVLLYDGAGGRLIESFEVRLRGDGTIGPGGVEQIETVVRPLVVAVAQEMEDKLAAAREEELAAAQERENQLAAKQQSARDEAVAEEVDTQAEQAPPRAPHERPLWSQSQFAFQAQSDYGSAPAFDDEFVIGFYSQRVNFEWASPSGVEVDSALVFEAATWNLDNPRFAAVGMRTVIDTVPQALPLQTSLFTASGDDPTAQRLEALLRFDRLSIASELGPARIRVGRQNYQVGVGTVLRLWDHVLTPLPPARPATQFRPGIDSVRLDLGVTRSLSFMVAHAIAVNWDQLDDKADLFRLDNARSLAQVGYAFTGGQLFGAAGVLHKMPVVGGGGMRQFGSYLLRTEGAFVFEENATATQSSFAMAMLAAQYVSPSAWTAGIEAGYSGFGALDPDDYLEVLIDPRLQGRRVPAALGQVLMSGFTAIPLHQRVSAVGVVLVNPIDGSGFVAPQVTVTDGVATQVTLQLVAPWGARPDEPLVPTSETALLPLQLLVNATHTF